MFDYDRWLESPYTDVVEDHTHDCNECEGQGVLWLEEEKRFDSEEPCPSCEDGQVICEDYCHDPDDYEEPDRDD
jgi:hypothetical protein